MEELRHLLRRYRIWNHHLEKLCNEIGENELLYRPMPESNSAAWIVAHLILHYREFLELTESPDGDNDLARLPNPGEEELGGMPFGQMFELLHAYRDAFLAAANQLGEQDALDKGAPAGEGKSWRDLIHTVVNHEIYHCGQLAYLARILQQKAKR